jgi:hypothetical protein
MDPQGKEENREIRIPHDKLGVRIQTRHNKEIVIDVLSTNFVFFGKILEGFPINELHTCSY